MYLLLIPSILFQKHSERDQLTETLFLLQQIPPAGAKCPFQDREQKHVLWQGHRVKNEASSILQKILGT